MANTLTPLVPSIIGMVLEVLRQNFALGSIVAKDYSGASAKKGSAVTVPVYASQAASAITPAITPPAIADKVVTSKTITIDQWYGSRFHATAKEGRDAELDDWSRAQVAEAVRALLYQISSNLFSKYTKIYGYAGTAGTNPFASNLDPLAALDQVLNDQLCPLGNRHLIINTTARQAALKLAAFQDASKRGDAEALKTGWLGSTLGFLGIMHDHQVPSHTAGTITTGLIAKAATAVAAGEKSFLGTTAASTGACALLVGDVIAIAGHTTTYTLTAAATQASAATDVTLAVEPGLEIALVGSEAITVKATHRVNIGGDFTGFGMVARQPAEDVLGGTGGEHYPFSDPLTGMPLLLSRYPGYHATQLELSALWGCEVVDPRKLARLAG